MRENMSKVIKPVKKRREVHMKEEELTRVLFFILLKQKS